MPLTPSGKTRIDSPRFNKLRQFVLSPKTAPPSLDHLPRKGREVKNRSTSRRKILGLSNSVAKAVQISKPSIGIWPVWLVRQPYRLCLQHFLFHVTLR